MKLNPVLLRVLTLFVSGGIAAVAGDGQVPSAVNSAFALAGVLVGALLPQLFASKPAPAPKA